MSGDQRLSAAPGERRALRRFWPLVRPHRWALVGAALVSLAATVAELAVPVAVGRAVDAAVGGDAGGLRTAAALVAALAGVQLVLEAWRRRAAAAAGERVLADMRRSVTAAVLGRPLAFFDANPPGEVLARVTADVGQLAGFVRHGMRRLVDALLLAVTTLVVLVATAWPLALVAMAYVPAALTAIAHYRRGAGPANAAEADGYAASTAAVAEAVGARATLQAANAPAWAAGRVAEADGRLLDANAAVLRADNRLSVTGWAQHLVLGAVVVAGGVLAQRRVVSVGEVVTVALALRRLFGPLDSMAWLYGQAVAARARLARILDLVGDGRPELLDEPGDHDGAPATADAAALVVDGVTFAYDGGPAVLHKASLRVAAGERVAIVGPSGAGKSTLAKLIAGLLEPGSGRVTLGGRPVGAGPGRRRPVVLIPQEGHVSAGTLADNLRLVPGEHTDDALVRAVAAAGLEAWVASLPAGLATELADRGANLSAGERQLVALARAALVDPEVLVLDEATADVDPATEAAVSAALGRLGQGRTLLVVAHRPATAARYGRVVTVVDGRLAEAGPSTRPTRKEELP